MNVNFINSDCNIVYNGAQNMSLDLSMLNNAIKNRYDFAQVRFYGWNPPCISLGRNQKEEGCFNDCGFDVIRRPTGGRALFHDKELTYCYVAPIVNGQSIIESYKDISDAIILGFKMLDVELEYCSNKTKNSRYCMNISCGADISHKGKKLVGSAQFRSQNYLLQHGSILIDADFELLDKIFKQKTDTNSITVLKEINPNIKTQDLIEVLKYGFKEKFEDKVNL